MSRPVTEKQIEQYRAEIDFSVLDRSGPLDPIERKFLQDHYAELGPSACARVLNRTPDSMRRWGSKLKLRFIHPKTELQRNIEALLSSGVSENIVAARLGCHVSTVHSTNRKQQEGYAMNRV